MTAFNKYAKYPTTQGIVHVHNIFGEHLWTMGADNIRVRVRNTDYHNNISHYDSWGEGRKILGDANRGQLVFSYIEMPGTSLEKIKEIAKVMDKESRSKQVVDLDMFTV